MARNLFVKTTVVCLAFAAISVHIVLPNARGLSVARYLACVFFVTATVWLVHLTKIAYQFWRESLPSDLP